MSPLMGVFIFLAGIGVGCLLEHWDARQKRGNWRPHRPSTDILKDYK